jgi:hypothetical protein
MLKSFTGFFSIKINIELIFNIMLVIKEYF